MTDYPHTLHPITSKVAVLTPLREQRSSQKHREDRLVEDLKKTLDGLTETQRHLLFSIVNADLRHALGLFLMGELNAFQARKDIET